MGSGDGGSLPHACQARQRAAGGRDRQQSAGRGVCQAHSVHRGGDRIPCCAIAAARRRLERRPQRRVKRPTASAKEKGKGKGKGKGKVSRAACPSVASREAAPAFRGPWPVGPETRPPEGVCN